MSVNFSESFPLELTCVFLAGDELCGRCKSKVLVSTGIICLCQRCRVYFSVVFSFLFHHNVISIFIVRPEITENSCQVQPIYF